MVRENEDLANVAQTLTGTAVLGMRRAGGGRNSRVFRLDTARGAFAFKSYPQDKGDRRTRLTTEFTALRYLAGFAAVPKAIAAAPEHNCALYEWAEGTPVVAHGAADVTALVMFLRAAHARRHAAPAFDEAAEACLSEQALCEQLVNRRARLERRADARLSRFLQSYDRVAALVLPDRPDPRVLAPADRTLSASDAGFHNALRRPDGTLVFLDLEYFGWDDPVKLVADVLWHPGMTLSDAERAQFFGEAVDTYDNDDAFEARFSSRYALFGLRWSLIVLNEFLDAVWQRRVEAGERRSRQAVEDEQLAKAERLLGAVRNLRGEIDVYAR